MTDPSKLQLHLCSYAQMGVGSAYQRNRGRVASTTGPTASGVEVRMQQQPTDTSYFAKGAWLMGPDSEGEPSYLRLYRLPVDAERAARDLTRVGRAQHPAHYERLRMGGS